MKAKNPEKHQSRTVRIIGGKWRGRKVRFPNNSVIRPTGDRIRETLFNWLMFDLTGACCLDLYAGSGALGLEALSRGAAAVTFVETDAAIAETLGATLIELASDEGNVVNQNAADFLRATDDAYDLIFLDPPFDSAELPAAVEVIHQRNLARAFVYIESASNDMLLPEGWSIHRQKKAGDVYYCLVDLRDTASV